MARLVDCEADPERNRRLSVFAFALLSAWLLSFAFEGQIFYALADACGIAVRKTVFIAIAAQFAGLLLCGFFVQTLRMAGRFLYFSIIFCIACTALVFFAPPAVWTAALAAASLPAGGCIAAWGFYLMRWTPARERIKTVADLLIYSNIMMIALNILAAYVSPHAALALSMLALVAAAMLIRRLWRSGDAQVPAELTRQKTGAGVGKPLAFLYLFIVVITINSGLMYQVQGPAFAHLTWLTSWYWAVPYIAALIVVRNLPRSANRTYLLYVAIAMIGFSFIAFMLLDRSAASYLVVDTLMLAACGIYDLFWWSILGETLDLGENPARIYGIGLSANLLGVLLGGLIGSTLAAGKGNSFDATLLALGVVCITLVMLPPLHGRLTGLLKDHAYLTMIQDMPPQEKSRLLEDLAVCEKLTGRECEIASLLLAGKTYKMIAATLHVSENTVKTHVKNIYAKACVGSRSELISRWMQMRPIGSDSNAVEEPAFALTRKGG